MSKPSAICSAAHSVPTDVSDKMSSKATTQVSNAIVLAKYLGTEAARGQDTGYVCLERQQERCNQMQEPDG